MIYCRALTSNKLLLGLLLLLLGSVVTASTESSQAQQSEEFVSLRRQLASPQCGDTTCRRECGGKCSASEFDENCCSQCPSFCSGGGPVSTPAPVDPGCSTDGESCKGVPCCNGLVCKNLGRGNKQCAAVAPTFAPVTEPTSPPTTYSYIRSNSEGNVQGPDPTPENTVFKFYAIGDTPYDPNSNNCLDTTTGAVLDACPYYDCTSQAEEPECEPSCLPWPDNTCIYQGSDYECLKNTIIPGYLDPSQAVFVGHIGDILKGDAQGNHRRCTESSFTSRANLFGALESPPSGLNIDILDFFIIPGDNDWNECYGFDPNDENGFVETLWRAKFSDAATSPFSGFDRNTVPYIGAAPTVERHPTKSEIYFFLADNTAIFGINEPANSQPTGAGTDEANANWITDKLTANGCVSSIVIFGHDDSITSGAQSEVRGALNAYYSGTCGAVPTLYVAGDSHPIKYRLSFQETDFPADTVLMLTVEAFQAGPLLVSIVQDPTTGRHFFHVQDTDEPNNPNDVCP